MEKLRFLDCNCAVGRKMAPPLWSIQSPDDIVMQMEYCGIDLAFAWHNASLDCHPLEGNQEILKISEKYPRIKPVFTVIPNQAGEFIEPGELVSLMKNNGAGMARLFPRFNAHSFSLADWQCGDLFKAFEENGIAVLIHLDQTDWETIRTVCLAHTGMNLIVTNVNYRNSRYMIPLLRQLPNLYIESSGVKINNGLDEIVRPTSAEKILFGTNAGDFSMGAAVCLVTYSSISDNEKELVASKNLIRLLRLEESL
ncbi:MAG: hypothetical protein LBE10_04430 [Treponema sp.]|jgi:predicted TIM-barrel fold metal-dependent hydrolase|nr:hypothetical protein [Treponema sp.]